MKINWNFIDKFLIGEAETNDLTDECKQEIAEFLQTHNMEVFSDESLEQLSGIWDLAYKTAYESATGTKIPNIFKVIQQPEEEEQVEEVEDERQTLSSGF